MRIVELVLADRRAHSATMAVDKWSISMKMMTLFTLRHSSITFCSVVKDYNPEWMKQWVTMPGQSFTVPMRYLRAMCLLSYKTRRFRSLNKTLPNVNRTEWIIFIPLKSNLASIERTRVSKDKELIRKIGSHLLEMKTVRPWMQTKFSLAVKVVTSPICVSLEWSLSHLWSKMDLHCKSSMVKQASWLTANSAWMLLCHCLISTSAPFQTSLSNWITTV